MNLNSPLFDKVRIPSQQTLIRIIETVCHRNGTDIDKFRARRGMHQSNQTLDIRHQILAAARDAGIAPSPIAVWFGHRDSLTVLQWYADMDEAEVGVDVTDIIGRGGKHG